MTFFIYNGNNAGFIQFIPIVHEFMNKHNHSNWHMINRIYNKNAITFTNPKTGVKRLCRIGDPVIFNNDGSYYRDLEYLEEYKL